MQPTTPPADRPQARIYCGLPGCGKTTLIAKLPEPKLVVSADSYHIRPDGRYEYIPKFASAAHDACLRRFCQGVAERWPLLVVDNTNLSQWEIAPYYRFAEINGYDPVVVRIVCDPVAAYRRQTHGVPAARHLDMAQRYARLELPAFWRTEVIFAE